MGCHGLSWWFSLLLILLTTTIPFVKTQQPPRLSTKAFATIIHNDNEVLLARVLMHSIKAHGDTDKYPRYIFADSQVSDVAEQQILADDDDIIFQRLPNSRFSYSHLFNMSDTVSRVVYLAPSTLVVDDVSLLFNCGEFCAAFTTPCSFDTGVMVISPNKEIFEDVRKSYDELTDAKGVCSDNHRPDGLDKEGCVINERYGEKLYDAPLFRVKDEDTYGGKLKRLPFGCHINHLLFYPRFRWEIPEQACGKRRVIDFMGPGYFKPDKWWTYAVLDLGDIWLESRRQLVDPAAPNSFSVKEICWRVFLAGCAVLAVVCLLGSCSTSRNYQEYMGMDSKMFAKSDDRMYILVSVFGIQIGWLTSVFVGLTGTPATLMPFWGWLMFSSYKACFFIVWMLVLGSTFGASQANDEEIVKPKYRSSLRRAVFETMLFGFIDVVYPTIGILLIRRYATVSIYFRLMTFIPLVSSYFIITIILSGRISIIWLAYGAGHEALSPYKVAKQVLQIAFGMTGRVRRAAATVLPFRWEPVGATEQST